MEKRNLQDVVIAAIARAVNRPLESVSPDSTFQELELDSLGIASVISEVEDVFGLQLDPDQLMEFLAVKTVKDFLAVFSATEGAVDAAV